MRNHTVHIIIIYNTKEDNVGTYMCDCICKNCPYNLFYYVLYLKYYSERVTIYIARSDLAFFQPMSHSLCGVYKGH